MRKRRDSCEIRTIRRVADIARGVGFGRQVVPVGIMGWDSHKTAKPGRRPRDGLVRKIESRIGPAVTIMALLLVTLSIQCQAR